MTTTTRKILSSLFLLSLSLSPLLGATEYFVALDGNDTGDGLSRAKAFATIQKGVDTLQPGDTLTIAPGEYREKVARKGLGNGEADTIIRAEIPGTALLRGDTPVTEFKKIEGFRFVYGAPFEGSVQSVQEADTLTVLKKQVNLPELEFMAGTFVYDEKAKMLYVSSSDMLPPPRHHYTASVLPGSGLRLENPRRVILDGLAVTGFHDASVKGFEYYKSSQGISLVYPEGCTVRHCTAYLNASGIGLFDGGNNVVEYCEAYGNSTQYGTGDGGGIFRYHGNNDVIRHCRASRSLNSGIHFYDDPTGLVKVEDCFAWGNLGVNVDIQIKMAQNLGMKLGLAERCVTWGGFNVQNLKNNLLGGRNRYVPAEEFPRDSALYPHQTENEDFVDPLNFDFRLQSTSSLRGRGPKGVTRGPYPYAENVFFVSPKGDDNGDGLSLRSPWKTLDHALSRLKLGDTLYLLAGEYSISQPVSLNASADNRIQIRGRSQDAVRIASAVVLKDCTGLSWERVIFGQGVEIKGGGELAFSSCWFTGGGHGIAAKGARGLRVTHCAFADYPGAALAAGDSQNIYLAGNLFDNRSGAAVGAGEWKAVAYSDYNSYARPEGAWKTDGKTLDLSAVQEHADHYSRVIAPEWNVGDGVPEVGNEWLFESLGPLGRAIGPYAEFSQKSIAVAGPFLHSVSDTTANIEFWASTMAECELAWGETPACEKTTTLQMASFGSYSLTGLEPGKTYYFRIRKVKPAEVFNVTRMKALEPEGEPLKFMTAAKKSAPVVYYVATDGDDKNNGASREHAWRTLNHAAAQVGPGDTVLVGEGTYGETVWIRATGTKESPITFRSAPGEKVRMDGVDMLLSNAVMASAKDFVKFDGFYFRDWRSTNGMQDFVQDLGSAFNLYKCKNIEITRCLITATGKGYPGYFIAARGCPDLLIKNCVIAGLFHGMFISSCDNVRMENNLFLRNMIQAFILTNGPKEKLYLKNNIITDSGPNKVDVLLFEITNLDSLEEENNCYLLRLPDQERLMFAFYGGGGPKIFGRPLGRSSLEEYLKARERTSTSIFAAPEFAGATEDKKSSPDGLIPRQDLDFPDIFPANPKVQGMGPQPADFGDFHFNSKK